LERHPWVHFHFRPKGASWINLIEPWFGIVTKRFIRRGSFDAVRALVKHILSYITH
jgi:transposase